MNTPKSQRGMTAIGIASILALCGFVLMIFAKLTPSYLDQFKVSSALNGLQTDHRAVDASRAGLKTLILKKLEIDDVEYVNEENIVIKDAPGGLSIQIKYDRVVPMVSNIDAVFRFDETIELKR